MRKTSNFLKDYLIFSHGITTILVLGGLGFYIGYKINKSSILPGVLATIGSILGICVLMLMVYKGGYFDTKKEKPLGGEIKDEQR